MTTSEIQKHQAVQKRLDYLGYISGSLAVVGVIFYSYTMVHTMSLVGETKEYEGKSSEIAKSLPGLEEQYYTSFTELQDNLGTYEGLIVPDVVHYVLRKPSRSVAAAAQ